MSSPLIDKSVPSKYIRRLFLARPAPNPQELIRISPFLLLIIITYNTKESNHVHPRSIENLYTLEYERKLVDRSKRKKKKRKKKKKKTLDASNRDESIRGGGVSRTRHKRSQLFNIYPNLGIPSGESGEAESKLSGPGLKGHVNGPIAGGKGSGTAEFHLHPLAHERPYNGIIKWPVWSMAGRIRGKGDVVQIVKRLSGSLTHWFRYWNCYWFRIDRNALQGTHFDDYYYDNEFGEGGKKKEKN